MGDTEGVTEEVVVLAGLGLYLTGWELLPDVDQGEFRIHFRLPVGTPITETDRRISKIEEKISQMPEKQKITNIFSTVGASIATGELETEKSENLAEMAVILTPRQERKFSDNKLIEKVRKVIDYRHKIVHSGRDVTVLNYEEVPDLAILHSINHCTCDVHHGVVTEPNHH